MIEILGYKEINKGSIVGQINIKVTKWQLSLYRLMIFQKNNAKWIAFPSEKYEEDGKTKYFSLLRFDTKETHDNFQKAVFKALDEWKLKNTHKEIPEKIEEQDELPF